MDQIKAITFIEQKKEFLFPNDEYDELYIENLLMTAPEGTELFFDSIPFRDPSKVKLISIFVGSIGIDRFYLGDIGKGILKYFTFGGLGIWWIKDIISAKDRCRAYNCKKLIEVISNPAAADRMIRTDENINTAINTAKAFTPVVKEAVKGAKDIGKGFYVN